MMLSDLTFDAISKPALLEAELAARSVSTTPRPIIISTADLSAITTVERAFTFNPQSMALMREFFAQQAQIPGSLELVMEDDMPSHWEFLPALGTSSVDWRLAKPILAKALTLHLIDGESTSLTELRVISVLTIKFCGTTSFLCLLLRASSCISWI